MLLAKAGRLARAEWGISLLYSLAEELETRNCFAPQFTFCQQSAIANKQALLSAYGR
ncbi:hypothetical protein [Nostoc sp. LPT]|uniref:hypothetical protein n=1 Tax=Nostoc sp. LPT TaxID=2815387 RepID=UPI001D9E83EB|nr:hypothetical protein [Nostoc sp. LPT]MBN4002519.1 hypothetical protein [Nostoc sp. LPT]